MVDLLLSEDRKHLPNKVCRSEVNYLTVYNSCECYKYWKKRLSEIEKDLIQTKSRRTRLYKPLPDDLCRVINVSELKALTKEHLIYLNLLKKKVLELYVEAKTNYLDVQKKCSKKLEAETPLWKTVRGKFLHQVTVMNIFSPDKAFWKVHTTYYVQLDEMYSSFSNFMEGYNIQQIFQNEKEDLKKYSFSASYDLNSLMHFYNSEDFKIIIRPIDELPKGILSVSVFDVVQYKAFKNVSGSLADTHLTYAEFKKEFEYNSGEHLGILKKWFAVNFRDVLEKQFPGSEAYDAVDCGHVKKTYQSWKRYYDMWQTDETPEARRAKKNKK